MKVFKIPIFFRKKTDKYIAETDLFAPDFYQHFYSHYPKLLQHKKDVLFFPKSNCFGVFKYDLVRGILLDNSTFTSQNYAPQDPVLLGNDSEFHHVYKTVLYKETPHLNKKSLSSLDDEIRSCLDSVFYNLKLVSDKNYNFVEWGIQPYVFTVLFGKYFDLKKIKELDINTDSTDSYRQVIQEIGRLYVYPEDLSQTVLKISNNGHLSESLRKAITAINSHGQTDERDIAKFIFTLIAASLGTTVSLISSAIYTILSDSKYVSLTKEEIPLFLNEIARLFSPGNMTYRTTSKDCTVGGQEIPKNTLVALSIGAANIDERVFANPFSIDMNRPIKHLAFGQGVHGCVGKYTAMYLAEAFVAYFLKCGAKLHVDSFSVSNTRSTYNISEIMVHEQNRY